MDVQKNRNTIGKSKCILTTLLIALAILRFPWKASMAAADESAPYIDLFTQKAPFDGRGINQPSDMFGPQEKVVLYALVLLDDAPVNGTLVTYQVYGPDNSSKDLEFFQTAETNSSGIAQTEFTLTVANQTAAFGTWTAAASIQFGGQAYTDTLTFKVDYVIKILSVRTLDENLTDTENFGIFGYVGFEIALENNAMVKKNVTLAVTVFDELGVPVNSSQIHGMIIPPNRRIQYIYGNMLIPNLAVPGNATITVVALDEDLVAYGPTVSKGFIIQPVNPIFPNFVDAFVYVEASPTKVETGETVKLNLVVTNQGTVTLNELSVTLRVNGSFLDSHLIGSLSSYQSQAYEFDWNTSGLSEGTYVITAEVPVFPHEADLSDNTYSCQVEVIAKKPTILHDIQVTYANCSKNEANQGEILSIIVAVRNNGNLTESTNVSVYYDDVLIEKRLVPELLPATPQVLTFDWNTARVPNGTYEIIARVDPVEGETNLANNVFYDGLVHITLPPPPLPAHLSALLAVSFLALAISASTILFFFLLIMLDYLRRRRRKKRPSGYYVLIAHEGTR